MGHLMVNIGYHRTFVDPLRVTIGHLRVTICYLRANVHIFRVSIGIG